MSPFVIYLFYFIIIFIFILGGGVVFFVAFILFLMGSPVHIDPNQSPHYVVSYLGLHCLHMTL